LYRHGSDGGDPPHVVDDDRSRGARVVPATRQRDGAHGVPSGGRVLSNVRARPSGRGTGRGVRRPANVRLRGGGRRFRWLGGGQPADRGGQMVGVAGGGGRRGERHDGYSAVGQLPDRYRVRLGLPDRAARRRMRRYGGPQVPVAPGQGHGRHQRH